MSSAATPARLTRVLVANRGEIARRVIATLHRTGREAVAVYSDPDMGLAHVREADAAVHLPGATPSETYLRGDLIIEAARRAGAEAIHPGYGFLSENAAFARAVIDAGLTWIGPDPDCIESMGDKVRAKELAVAAGVPIMHLELDAVSDADFPVIVKAAAGGGGRGMRVVDKAADLDEALASAHREAESAFGVGEVFLEPYLVGARHIEVQVMADRAGGLWIAGDRDCSAQRRHQKVVEEAPAPRVHPDVRARLHTCAASLTKAVGYQGAGTIEFLVTDADRPDGSVYFLEMNTRLQVEHPVTECVFGVDLVALQLSVAEGGLLADRDLPDEPAGHAIEVRIYAEDPSRGWEPQAGVLRRWVAPGIEFDLPHRHGLRVDRYCSGDEVSVDYDPMLAKLVAWGPDRAAAIGLLARALNRTEVFGVVTNIPHLLRILTDDAFATARLSTAFLETIDTEDSVDAELVAVTAVVASVQSRRRDSALPGVTWGFRNVESSPLRCTVDVRGRLVDVAYRSEAGAIDILEPAGIEVVADGHGRVLLRSSGVDRSVGFTDLGGQVDVMTADGAVTARVLPRLGDGDDAAAGPGNLRSPMPGVVVAVVVETGDRVAAGDVVAVMEAMKMEHRIEAGHDGIVAEVFLTTGDRLAADAVLVRIEEEPA